MKITGSILLVDNENNVVRRRRYSWRGRRRELFEKYSAIKQVVEGTCFIHFIPDVPLWSEQPVKEIKKEEDMKILLPSQEKVIKEFLATMPPRKLAEKVGVSVTTIYNHKNRLLKKDPVLVHEVPSPPMIRHKAVYSNHNNIEKYFQ